MTLPVEQPVITVDGQVQGADDARSPVDQGRAVAVGRYGRRQAATFSTKGTTFGMSSGSKCITYRQLRSPPDHANFMGVFRPNVAAPIGRDESRPLMRVHHNDGIFVIQRGRLTGVNTKIR